ncbi:uncharacterized protein LOC133316036 [Gastrolobium bilobum]|uniref:uncharacterized protein LOC133316036 n=1 Tax=Gastrolobium bilobum TaxID=150636 RepID=UPI002AB257E9|nr:uncharacterized protein LOC133316036 [Gastrolobium bilobum]
MSKKHKCDMAVILEPKVSGVHAAKIIRSLGYDDSIIEEAVGFSRGIWILWNQSSCSVKIIEKRDQFILIQVSIPNKQPFLFIAIYANPRIEIRQTLWDDLRRLHASFEEPWLLAGDFNEILTASEKRGGTPVNLSRCSEFSSVLDDSKLLDLGSCGSRFTWKGPKFSHLDRVFKRLDRAMANTQWRLCYEEVVVKVLPRLYSDHSPLLISLFNSSTDWTPRPFRLFPPSLEHPNFKQVLEENWDSHSETSANLSRLVPILRD